MICQRLVILNALLTYDVSFYNVFVGTKPCDTMRNIYLQVWPQTEHSRFLIPQFLLTSSLVTNTRYFLSSDKFNLLVKKKVCKQSLSKTSNLAVTFVFFPRKKWCLEKAASLAHVIVQVVWPKKHHQVKSTTTPCSRSALFFLLCHVIIDKTLFKDKLIKINILNCFIKDAYCMYAHRVKYSHYRRIQCHCIIDLVMTPKN